MKHFIKITFLLICIITFTQAAKQLFDQVENEQKDNKNSEASSDAPQSLFGSNPEEKKDDEVSFAQKTEENEELNKEKNSESKEESLFGESDNKSKETESPQLENKTEESLLNEENADKINIKNKKPEIDNLLHSESENIKPQVTLNDNITPKANPVIIADKEDKEDKEDEDKEDKKGEEILNKEIKKDEKEEKKTTEKKEKKTTEKKEKKTTEKKTTEKKETSKSKNSKKQKNSTQKKNNKSTNSKAKEDKKTDKTNKNKKTSNNSDNKNNKKSDVEKSNSNPSTKNNNHNLLKETLIEDKDEIEKLKTKVFSLIRMNKSLLAEIDKRRKMKNLTQEASEDLVELIQKSENPINFLQKKMMKLQDVVQEKIKEKDSVLKSEHQKLRTNLDHLVEKLQIVGKSLKEVSSDEALANGEVKRNYETDKLNVTENVQNDGITYVNNVHAEELDLGNVKFDMEKVLFNNPDSEIIVGSNILSLRELVNNMELMEKLNSRCGSDMEKCINYNEKILEKELKNENKIIEGVKSLRKETQKINKEMAHR